MSDEEKGWLKSAQEENVDLKGVKRIGAEEAEWFETFKVSGPAQKTRFRTFIGKQTGQSVRQQNQQQFVTQNQLRDQLRASRWYAM